MTFFRTAAVLLAFSAAACATTQSGKARRAVERYLSAPALEAASALLAPEYRIWFGERSGAGTDRAAAIAMLQWDFALNPYHRIDEMTVNDGTVVVRVHEENDFSRLIGFPGWNATSTFTVDENGLITSQVYVPDPAQADWRPYLEPALTWIRTNRPGVLERIYPGGKLAQTADAAREWVAVLKAWRRATAQTGTVAP